MAQFYWDLEAEPLKSGAWRGHVFVFTRNYAQPDERGAQEVVVYIKLGLATEV